MSSTQSPCMATQKEAAVAAQEPPAMDKGRHKTAVLEAGVQEDVNRLREKLNALMYDPNAGLSLRGLLWLCRSPLQWTRRVPRRLCWQGACRRI